ncbi:MAG: metal-sensitive transcriptional regulator [Candidatus Lambdaproteobacteria bacterium]|nr:metal-sensitive transcriptional regulator [Candidatus Lambdaproteobacteria bacterium]
MYPSHEGQLQRLNKIQGQISGVRKMIEEHRYCMDIVAQIKAVTAALKQVQMGVLETHVHHCVMEAVSSGKPDQLDAKIEELMTALTRIE